MYKMIFSITGLKLLLFQDNPGPVFKRGVFRARNVGLMLFVNCMTQIPSSQLILSSSLPHIRVQLSGVGGLRYSIIELRCNLHIFDQVFMALTASQRGLYFIKEPFSFTRYSSLFVYYIYIIKLLLSSRYICLPNKPETCIGTQPCNVYMRTVYTVQYTVHCTV